MAIFPAFRKTILENSSNLFTKRKNCDTIIAPNKKRIMILRRAPYFCRGLYAFLNFLHKLVNNGKNVDSANLCMVFSVSLVFCLATIGVGVFRCGNSGCRTFFEEENNQ